MVHLLLTYLICKITLRVGKSGTKALASTGGANTVQSTGNVGGSTANATLSTAQLASHSHSGGVSDAGTTSPNPNPVVDKVLVTNTGSTGSGTGHSHNYECNIYR